MRAALALIACAVPAIAHADPIDVERCSITYVTVPEGVKDVIEGWVAAEPHCRGTIALRVIPTKDGYFLFAERPDGTVHERLVPDLTAAGVLVASWVADSWRLERPKKKKKKHHQLEVRAVAEDHVEITDDPPPAPPRERWISVGGTLIPGAPRGDLGFRFEADMLVYGGWRIAVAAQKVEDTLFIDTGWDVRTGQINDWSAGAVLSRTVRWGGWELRGGLGMYALGSTLRAEDFDFAYDPYNSSYRMEPFDIETTTAFELSASLSRDIGESWGISAALAAMYIDQDWTSPNDPRMDQTRQEAQRSVVFSLRRRI